MRLLLDTHAFLWFDPFDRMLVAQAQVEGLSIVSVDQKLGGYGVPIIW